MAKKRSHSEKASGRHKPSTLALRAIYSHAKTKRQLPVRIATSYISIFLLGPPFADAATRLVDRFDLDWLFVAIVPYMNAIDRPLPESWIAQPDMRSASSFWETFLAIAHYGIQPVLLDALPITVVTLTFSILVIAMSFVAGGVIGPTLLRWIMLPRALERHLATPKCLWCGYDLRGIRPTRAWWTCPECGDKSPATTRPFFPRRYGVMHFRIRRRAVLNRRYRRNGTSRRQILWRGALRLRRFEWICTILFNLCFWLALILNFAGNSYQQQTSSEFPCPTIGLFLYCLVGIQAGSLMALVFLPTTPLYILYRARATVNRAIDNRRCFWCRASLESVTVENNYRRCPDCRRLSPASMDIFTKSASRSRK